MSPGPRPKVLELLASRPGLTAREIREALGADSVAAVQSTLRTLRSRGRVRGSNEVPERWFAGGDERRAE